MNFVYKRSWIYRFKKASVLQFKMFPLLIRHRRQQQQCSTSSQSGEELFFNNLQWTESEFLPSYCDFHLSTKLPDDCKFIPLIMNFSIPGETYHPADPLNPPPPQFERTPHYLDTSYFRPLSIYAVCRDICHGLFPLYPVDLASKDVLQDDWIRFLEDLVVSARYPGNPGSDVQLKRHYKRERYPKVSLLLEKWNNNFFRVRGIHVLLKESRCNPRLYLVSLNQMGALTCANRNNSRSIGLEDLRWRFMRAAHLATV